MQKFYWDLVDSNKKKIWFVYLIIYSPPLTQIIGTDLLLVIRKLPDWRIQELRLFGHCSPQLTLYGSSSCFPAIRLQHLSDSNNNLAIYTTPTSPSSAPCQFPKGFKTQRCVWCKVWKKAHSHQASCPILKHEHTSFPDPGWPAVTLLEHGYLLHICHQVITRHCFMTS